MLASVAPGADKTEKADALVVAPAVVVTPAPVTPLVPVEVIAKANPEVSDLRKMVEDLRQVVASQAKTIEKAQEPRQSNVIPLAQTVPSSGTINAEGTHWPADMAPSSRKSTKF